MKTSNNKKEKQKLNEILHEPGAIMVYQNALHGDNSSCKQQNGDRMEKC